MANKFPHVIAAVEQLETQLVLTESAMVWKIGDALLEDIGPVVSAGGKDRQVMTKIEACSAEIKRRGYSDPRYSGSRLHQMRAIADAFPRSRRYGDLSFETHREAGNPDFLDWMVEEHGWDFSRRDVRKMRAQWIKVRDRQQAEDRKRLEHLASNAQDPSTRKRAQDRIDQQREMPPARPTAPTKREKHGMQALSGMLDIERALSGTLKILRGVLPELRKIGDLNPDYVEGYLEDCEKIEEVAKQIAVYLRQQRLTVISGGKQHA